MHIIGIIIAIASAVFWVSRAARGAKDIADVASSIKNAPRRMKFKKNASQRGIDLIGNPMEAATILMVCMARLSNYAQNHDGLLSPNSKNIIITILKSDMEISGYEADELLTQMRWTVKELTQPETALAPMTGVLTGQINTAELQDLSDMLSKVAGSDDGPNSAQKTFLTTFRNRTGLGR